MFKVISFGYRCSSATFLQILQLKTESYPFDWLVSKLGTIQDCIETNFVHFLDANNYSGHTTETYNIIDDKKIHIENEHAHVNTYYENGKNITSTYQSKLSLNHQNIHHDYDYYQRCIDRLYELFETDIQKYYLYFHPIMGINDFKDNKEGVLTEFDDFSQFIIKKTTNIFGLYFILVKHDESIKSIKLQETCNYDVYVIYCNENFVDGDPPFMGTYDTEKEEILSILRTYFI